ncbi:MAG: tRNA pseudouridine(38-40) synthase TruA [Thermodesulfovibrionales bacterium]|nr:tRNA pseudouridine(38-40) synthase TruA [Thermodesulfovibrionales bacterium]
MRNIKLVMEYDGSHYNGWQRQTALKNTVQGRIEHVLQLMTGEKIELHGAGRTDTGVHALGQVANFHTQSQKRLSEIEDYLHKYFPDDINLLDIQEMPERFHSRLNAKGKKYLYRIWNHPLTNIFNRRYYLHIKKPLNVEKMKQAADLFIGTKDFRSFTALKSKKKSTVRTLSKIEFLKKESEITLNFSGDGFLHKMVRVITGTLIQVGLGELSVSEVKEMFEKEKRSAAGFTAPPHALFLVKVVY